MKMQYEKHSTRNILSDQPLHIDATAGIAVSSFFLILLLIFAFASYAIHRFFSRQKGLSIPLFKAPQGFSPAGAGYVLNGWIDERLCMASIMNMRNNGFLTITKENDRYLLKKSQENYSNLTEEEICLANSLFKKNDIYTFVDITREWITPEDPILVQGLQCYKESIKKNYHQYISSTRIFLYISLFFTMLAICLTAIAMKMEFIIFMMLIFSTLFLYSFIFGLFYYAKDKKKGYFIHFFLFIVFSILPFIYFQKHYIELSPEIILPFLNIIAMFMINGFLWRLPVLYVGKNRKIRNELEGLKRYLLTAESERYKMLNNPDVPLQEKETLLPYAIAFGVENEWTKRLQGQFAAVLFKVNK